MAKNNKNITFKGTKLTVTGREINEGAEMPRFKLTSNDMGDLSSDQFKGKVLIIAVVPSLDTPTCAIETKRFNTEAANLSSDITILTVSMDLPFAQKRWCAAEGVEKVVTASDYKYRAFGEDFGVFIPDWGLLARAVFVVDRKGKISYLEYVDEISAEPNYNAALDAAKKALESA